MNSKLAFSLLPLLNKFDKQLLQQFYDEGLKLIHYDVMDRFVNNTAFQGEHLDDLKQIGFVINVHLMVEQLKTTLPFYVNHSAVNRISFHIEPHDLPTVKWALDLIKQHKKQVGLAFKFTTNLDDYHQFFKHLDFVTLMSVVPGSGGQPFNDAVFANLSRAQAAKLKIEIDGGIKVENVDQIKDNVDFIVMGSGYIKLDHEKRLALLQRLSSWYKYENYQN